jgi:transposase
MSPADQLPENGIEPIEIFTQNHSLIAAQFCHKIGIANIVNSLVKSQATIDPGTIVTAMVLDTLSGRRPLYRLHEFFEGRDTHMLLGREIAAEAFNDDIVGRTLDGIFETGSLKIFTEISLKACELYELNARCGNFDTTSFSLWGQYEAAADERAPRVARGYSKDKRPDLKQLMFSLLCVEGNIPVMGAVIDGNKADTKANNTQLEQVAELCRRSGVAREDFLYIADCKLVSEDNLRLLGDNPFVTRLPANYKCQESLIDEALALEAHKWTLAGKFNVTPDTQKRPAATYRVTELETELYGKKYRAVIVHSSNHDQMVEKRLQRMKQKAQKELARVIGKASKVQYHCQSDAHKALGALVARHSEGQLTLGGEVVERKIHAPGKVAAGEERKVRQLFYTLSLAVGENPEATKAAQARAGYFVLLSNCDKQKWSAADCLGEYKGQHGIERNFSFLKDPLIVNDIFLKKPERISALGLVLLLALLVYSLMEHLMRRGAQRGEVTLTNLDNKPTMRPTTFILKYKFERILTLVLPGGRRRLLKPLKTDQMNYLYSLGLNYKIFTDPPVVLAGNGEK